MAPGSTALEPEIRISRQARQGSQRRCACAGQLHRRVIFSIELPLELGGAEVTLTGRGELAAPPDLAVERVLSNEAMDVFTEVRHATEITESRRGRTSQ
jgi:hypothetical protein